MWQHFFASIKLNTWSPLRQLALPEAFLGMAGLSVWSVLGVFEQLRVSK